MTPRHVTIGLIGLLALIVVLAVFQNSSSGPELPYSDFVKATRKSEITDAVVSGKRVTGHFTDGRPFQTYSPTDENELAVGLDKAGVRVTVRPPEQPMPPVLGILISWFPALLMTAVWWTIFRQVRTATDALRKLSQTVAALAKNGDTNL